MMANYPFKYCSEVKYTANVYSSCFYSIVKGSPLTAFQQQHPKGPYEDFKNEHSHSDLFHSLLDAVLLAGSLVLVPS